MEGGRKEGSKGGREVVTYRQEPPGTGYRIYPSYFHLPPPPHNHIYWMTPHLRLPPPPPPTHAPKFLQPTPLEQSQTSNAA